MQKSFRCKGSLAFLCLAAATSWGVRAAGDSGWDLLSYLAFQPGYIGRLMELGSAFHAELVEDLHEAAEGRGYDVVLSTVTRTRDERRATETLVDFRCEALVLLGPVALLHFDAHLDTWDTYFGAAYTHGTPFRRASEEGLIDMERSLHMGIRGADRAIHVESRSAASSIAASSPVSTRSSAS